MLGKILLFTLFFVSVHSSRDLFKFLHDKDNDSSEEKDNSLQFCSPYHPCLKPNYVCRYGFCICGSEFQRNDYSECIRCPGLGETCSGACCSGNDGEWQGWLECRNNICQLAYDPDEHDENRDNDVFISATQIAMAVSLVLAIFATFVLLYKLCRKSDARRINGHRNRLAQSSNDGDSNTSNGTLQHYVNERLRDPPPRYSRNQSRAAPTAPPLPVILPVSDNPPAYDQLNGMENPSFMSDTFRIPPPYSPVIPGQPVGNETKEKEQESGGHRDINERTNHM